MNLSLWDSYTPDQQQTFAAKMVQKTKSHEMPLPQYRMIHWNAAITPADLQILQRWAHDAPVGGTVAASGNGDPAAGKQDFEKRCTGCHSLTSDREGPRLGSVYGPWEYATGVRDTLSPMLQVLECARSGREAVLGPPWRGDFTFSRDIATGLVAIAAAPVLPRGVYNLATGRVSTAEDWCRVVAARLPGFRWHRAAEGELGNVESHTGFDRGAMDIGKLTGDTTYRPRFDLAGAADHLLAWRQAG